LGSEEAGAEGIGAIELRRQVLAAVTRHGTTRSVATPPRPPANGAHEPLVVDDAVLIGRIKNADPQAATELYRRYFDDFFRYARVVLRDSAEAGDACHDAFVKIVTMASRYQPRSGVPARAWLFSVLRTATLDILRSRKKELAELQGPVDLAATQECAGRWHEDELPPGVTNALSWISDKDLAILMRRLPPAQREVLTLRYVIGLTTNEIATVIERTPRAVHTLEFRALRCLKEHLTKLGRDLASFRREWTRARTRRMPVVRARRFALTRDPGMSAFGRRPSWASAGGGAAASRRVW
jgi:RNA polymerase sigma-70 factor (ECF subfamily)